MSGCVVSAAPATAPVPVTTFTTPGGKPARANSGTSSSSEADVYSLGLATMVLPAASAGASFQVARSSGEFQGAIAATTPTGSRTVKFTTEATSMGGTEPSSLSASPPKKRYQRPSAAACARVSRKSLPLSRVSIRASASALWSSTRSAKS